MVSLKAREDEHISSLKANMEQWFADLNAIRGARIVTQQLLEEEVNNLIETEGEE
ncbi:MAG: hypothetical protein ACXADX_19815 [Candidatus Hodarchaeales archaeon]